LITITKRYAENIICKIFEIVAVPLLDSDNGSNVNLPTIQRIKIRQDMKKELPGNALVSSKRNIL